MNTAVELCISDNASTDGTEEMVKGYSKRHKFISYHRNGENIGFDRNFIAVLEKARGEYCWFIGDDDYFMKGAIGSVVKTLRRRRPDYAMVEFRTLHREGTLFWKGPPELRGKGRIKDFFVKNPMPMSFIGANIISKASYETIKADLPERYHDFMHVALQFYALKTVRTAYVIVHPKILATQEGSVASKRTALLIHVKLSRTFKQLRETGFISEEDYKTAVRATYHNFLVYVIFYFATIEEDGCERKELQMILDETKGYLSSVGKYTFPYRVTFILIKVKTLMKAANLTYRYIYVKFMNLFRRRKVVGVQEFLKENKEKGARDILFDD